jgi:hypothetical protein
MLRRAWRALPDPAREAVERGRAAYGTATGDLRVLPDYLIVGGQRCGSTSLHNYLAGHPLVGRPRIKEIQYLSMEHARGERWYRGHFPTRAYAAAVGARRGRPLMVGEASPYYLFHPLAPRRAAALLPDARIIAVLRDPVARAYSHYQMEVAQGHEPLGFAEALDAEQERLAGELERIERDPSYPAFAFRNFSYQARGDYLEQLRRWYDAYPAERILVLRSEDLFADPGGVVAQTLEFLGLPRFRGQRYRQLNRRAYAGIDEAVQRRLAERFAPGNERLGAFLGRDMDWPAPPTDM